MRRFGAGLVIEDVWTRGAWTLAPALRVEHRDDDFVAGAAGTIPPPASDLAETDFSAKLGVAWAFAPAWSLRASAGRFFRAPHLLELFGDRGLVRGNPDLVSESGIKAELGVERRASAWGSLVVGGELVAHAADISDLIVFQLNSQSTAVPRNIGDARIVGLEASLTISGWRGLSITAAGALQRARDRTPGRLDGKPLPGRPERFGSVGATWKSEKWEVGWNLTYVGENTADPLDEAGYARLPERVLHDLRVRRELGAGLSLGLEVRNAFDDRTLDVLRFPLPGRLVYASLGWRGSWPR